MKKIFFFLLIFNLGFSFWLYTLPVHDTLFNYLYNMTFGINFLIASIVSFNMARKCATHRMIHLTLSFASLSYFIAQTMWFLYNYFLSSDIPYPGYPDIFFIGFYIFAILGGILIMRQSLDIKFSIGKLIEISLITLVLFIIINSFILSSNAQQESLPLLTQVFNYLYPVLDALLVALSLTGIRSRLGSLQPIILYFLIGFITLTFADTLFSYFTSIDGYWNGNFIDAIFAISSFFLAMGIISLPKLLHPEGDKIAIK